MKGKFHKVSKFKGKFQEFRVFRDTVIQSFLNLGSAKFFSGIYIVVSTWVKSQSTSR